MRTRLARRFNTNTELRNFQNCQSVQKLFIDQVLNKGYKTPLTNPPSELWVGMCRQPGARRWRRRRCTPTCLTTTPPTCPCAEYSRC